MTGRLLVAAACAIVFTPPVEAQNLALSDTVRATRAEGRTLRAPDRVAFATSAAFQSPASGWLGRTPGRDVFVTTIRGTWNVRGREVGPSLGYFAELTPFAVVTGNPIEVMPVRECVVYNPEWIGRSSIPAIDYFERCATRSASAAGAGVTPLGLSARITRRSGFSFATDLSVGAILFDKSMPYPTATRLNYIITAGTSFDLPVRRRSVLTIGYQMHHLSNGGMGEFNPGILAHAVHLGWGRRR